MDVCNCVCVCVFSLVRQALEAFQRGDMQQNTPPVSHPLNLHVGRWHNLPDLVHIRERIPHRVDETLCNKGSQVKERCSSFIPE